MNGPLPDPVSSPPVPAPRSWLLVSALLLGCTQAGNEYVEPPPPTVTYALPIEAPITPFVDENGITEAAQEAEVRARVRGFLQSIEFEPGDPVKQGDVLYTIEKDQYEAAVEAANAAVENAVSAIAVAEAEVKIAEARVLKANQDLDREERLKEQNASSQASFDAAVAESAAAKAALESAQAAIKSAQSQKLQAEAALRQAKLELDYTTVVAVIDGRITKTNFKVGNLVENGSHLATIVDDSKVFANFSVSDRAVVNRLRTRETLSERQGLTDADQWRGTPVYLAREGDTGYPFEGTLNYIDQAGVQVDTGTLGLRGLFENPDGALLPGLFVSLRVPAAEAVTTMLIPERAVLRDQQGTYVLTIDDDNNIARARINLGQTVSGWAMVLDGIGPTDRVVVEGLQFARPDSKVIPEETSYDVDAEGLLRGFADPDRVEKPSPPEQSGLPPADPSAPPQAP